MLNTQRMLNYAKQNGQFVIPNDVESLKNLTAPELRDIAKSRGLPVTSRTKKGEILEMLLGTEPVVDEARLTPRQRRRLRHKAGTQEAPSAGS